MAALSFVHHYQPPAEAGAPTLLLLHGTGGDEHDLVPLARQLMPGAGVLSPRGQVLEHGMPRFFRRLAEGVFDLEDLARRTADLGTFIVDAAAAYGFDGRRVIAVGFSNGANIASSLLLTRPELLGASVLFRAMVPFVPEVRPALSGAPVLLSNGRQDPLIAPEETERLATLLRRSGADVTLEWQQAGHNLTQQDITRAHSWIGSLVW